MKMKLAKITTVRIVILTCEIACLGPLVTLLIRNCLVFLLFLCKTRPLEFSEILLKICFLFLLKQLS